MENKELSESDDFLGIQDLIAENIEQVSAGNAAFWQHVSNGNCPPDTCV
ncbi:hypothetical protein [Xanthomonas bonasiae]|nr:hypothetical protein [Xanthomonas surreyensis]MBD7922488.1 hypothetical protein [Xanthomonas surreyensis]